MPLYLFFPCKPDGFAPSFEALQLASDDVAAHLARALLREHPHAASMSVWRDERQVAHVLREPERKPGRLCEVAARRPAEPAPKMPPPERRRRNDRVERGSGTWRRKSRRLWPYA